MTTLHILCAGAAQGLVKAMEPGFSARTGAVIAGRFGAVGAMKEALLAGTPCDLMVVTQRMVDELCGAGHLLPGTRRALGGVRTGIAVRRGDPHPDVSTADALRETLLAAQAIYFPDPQRATAGIHFANLMRELGVHDALSGRFRTFPGGAVAMRELAQGASPGGLGCTQVSEILYTEGVELVGPLPARFELSTVYSGAVATHAVRADLAEVLLEMLTGPDSLAQRRAGGFEA